MEEYQKVVYTETESPLNKIEAAKKILQLGALEEEFYNPYKRLGFECLHHIAEEISKISNFANKANQTILLAKTLHELGETTIASELCASIVRESPREIISVGKNIARALVEFKDQDKNPLIHLICVTILKQNKETGPEIYDEEVIRILASVGGQYKARAITLCTNFAKNNTQAQQLLIELQGEK